MCNDESLHQQEHVENSVKKARNLAIDKRRAEKKSRIDPQSFVNDRKTCSGEEKNKIEAAHCQKNSSKGGCIDYWCSCCDNIWFIGNIEEDLAIGASRDYELELVRENIEKVSFFS